MKKFLVAALGVIALGAAAPASAADLAARPYTKAPPMMVAAVYDWSGFYIGANGGGAWSRKCWDLNNNFGRLVVPAAAEGCHDATGATAGGQIGYRWQSAAWVFGLEAQGNWADLRGSNTSLVFGTPFANRTRVDALGLFTGQVGYSWNTFLLYVKGGAAVTDDKYTGYVINGADFDQAKQTRWGAAVGVGGEYAFSPNWSLAIEYDHLFMGDRDVSMYSTTVPGLFSRTDRIRQDLDMVTARLNYRWGGPVVAKY